MVRWNSHGEIFISVCDFLTRAISFYLMLNLIVDANLQRIIIGNNFN